MGGIVAPDPTLDAMFDAGRREWPDVGLERDQFARYVEERAPSPEERPFLRAAELYLACACAHGDDRALAEFDRRYLCEVPSFLARMNLTASFVDDVRQRVRERLFVKRKIEQYSGRGTLPSWLRVVTVRVASNLLQEDKPHADLPDALPGNVLDPELRLIQRRYGEAFREALRDALVGLDVEDRNLLRLHYLDGLNIARIGVVFQVSRATIGRRLVEVRERIVREAYRLLESRLKATPEELASLLRVVRSDLVVSLSVILRERR
jgi:RNA polymerase sigma-70 factor (ECF subfamily)